MKRAEKNKLDKQWSDSVKKRDRNQCQRCGTTVKKLEAAHIVGRNAFKTRWLLKNGITLCFEHHQEYDQHRNNAEEWLIGYIGRTFWEELQELSRPCNAGGNYFYEDLKLKLEQDLLRTKKE